MKNLFDKFHFLAARGFKTLSFGVMECPQRELFDVEKQVMDDMVENHHVVFVGVPDEAQQSQELRS